MCEREMDAMALVNVTETLVKMLFEEIFVQKGALACDCDECRDDILARTLTRLPSRYVASDKGMIFVKAEYLDPQLQSDILRELTVAVNLVGNKPHHKV